MARKFLIFELKYFFPDIHTARSGNICRDKLQNDETDCKGDFNFQLTLHAQMAIFPIYNDTLKSFV